MLILSLLSQINHCGVIRPHTLAVFMKGDIDAREATGIPLNRWTLEDIKRNTDKIAKEIGKNFNAWLTQNN